MLLPEACFYALLWIALVPTECGVWRWRDVLRAAQLRKSALRAGDLERKPIPFAQLMRGKVLQTAVGSRAEADDLRRTAEFE